MRSRRKSLSQVQREKKVLSSHTTINPPSQRSNMGKFCFDFKLDANNAEADADKADAVEAIEAKANKTIEAN